MDETVINDLIRRVFVMEHMFNHLACAVVSLTDNPEGMAEYIRHRVESKAPFDSEGLAIMERHLTWIEEAARAEARDRDAG